MKHSVTQDEIIRRISELIAAGEADEATFDAAARMVFAYQFVNNEPYRRFAQARGLTPRSVRSWRAIPAMPIRAFKELTLSCTPPETASHVFMTSGTTGQARGRSVHPVLDVWRLSMTENFRRHFMGGETRIRMGVLFASREAMPNSSLAHYLSLAVERFGAEGSRHLIGPDGLDEHALVADLESAEAAGEPYALMGASFSFVHAMDALERLGRTFRLAAGSRLLDTGGFKGQSRALEPEVFYGMLESFFGVPRARAINMYGMTELSTQFYDAGNHVQPPVKRGPHWIRTRVVDPLSGREMERGRVGVLVHHDLAHFNSVSAILTEDLGAEVEDGFVLLGRAEGAEARGCSLALDDFLRARERAHG